MAQPKRVLIKLSGEALSGKADMGIDPNFIDFVADEVIKAVREGTQIGMVVGGGNFLRGQELAQKGLDRVTSDMMGMLATIMNGLAIESCFRNKGIPTVVMSALSQDRKVCEPFVRRRALRLMEKGRVLIFVGGTGNPFFSTDSAAALRAAEIGADILLKATQVDGVYDSDPHKNPEAKRFDHLSYTEVLEKNLAVMDMAAVALCRENKIPIRVFELDQHNNLRSLLEGAEIGTLIEEC